MFEQQLGLLTANQERNEATRIEAEERLRALVEEFEKYKSSGNAERELGNVEAALRVKETECLQISTELERIRGLNDQITNKFAMLEQNIQMQDAEAFREAENMFQRELDAARNKELELTRELNTLRVDYRRLEEGGGVVGQQRVAVAMQPVDQMATIQLQTLRSEKSECDRRMQLAEDELHKLQLKHTTMTADFESQITRLQRTIKDKATRVQSLQQALIVAAGGGGGGGMMMSAMGAPLPGMGGRMMGGSSHELDGLYDTVERVKSEKAVLETKLKEKTRFFDESFRQQEVHRKDLQRQIAVLREQNDDLKRKYSDQLRQLQDAKVKPVRQPPP